jgi:hypothetical protein
MSRNNTVSMNENLNYLSCLPFQGLPATSETIQAVLSNSNSLSNQITCPAGQSQYVLTNMSDPYYANVKQMIVCADSKTANKNMFATVWNQNSNPNEIGYVGADTNMVCIYKDPTVPNALPFMTPTPGALY